MSKRQALGAITINSNATAASAVFNQHANRAANAKLASVAGGGLGAASAVAMTGNANLFNKPVPQQQQLKGAYNNENHPPPSSSSAAGAAGKSKQNEFEFEIFQEERLTNAGIQPAMRNPLGSLPTTTTAQAPRLREKQVNFFLDVAEDEEDQVNDEEEEDEIAHDKRKYDDEDDEEEEEEEDDEYHDEDEDDDDEDEDKENDEDELEEEGISRLNIAAMMDTVSSSSSLGLKSSQQNQQLQEQDMNMSHCDLMMDSSSSTQNDDSVSSPMLLDDTIKGASSFKNATSSSLYIDDEDEEQEGEEESGGEQCENELDDEETQRRLASLERDNVMMNFVEYKDEILAYMKKLELENRPKANYMRKQMDITSNMRSILVDWLVEVCEEYKLNVETLYLAVNYTDRFLSQMSVLRGKLQLVGTASMYIAAKYEEITPPDISEFVYITDDTYTRKQVLRMEHLLLKVLDFKMSSPTANWFLSYYLRYIRQFTSLSHANNNELGQRIENLARYLCELTLIESDTFLAFLPSQIAASAIYLAMYTLGRPWTKQIADICGGFSADLAELKPCIQEMFKTMQGALEHPQQAIQEKYKQHKYDYVALIEPPKTLPHHLAAGTSTAV